MLQFAFPQLLWLATLIPLMVFMYAGYRRWRKKKLMKLGNRDVLEQILSGTNTRHHHTKFILQLLVFALMTVAAAQPRIILKNQKKTIRSADVMICLDVSNSMLAEDIKPNRLIRAKQAISTLIRQFGNEQVGLILFAGEAYIQVPLTTDKTTAAMLLGNISASDISNQGTAIADAISLAVRSFSENRDNPASPRCIILVTDGEDHEGSVTEEAKLAASKGIAIFTVGVGEPNSVPLPLYEDGILTGYKKDHDGNTILSSMNPKLLNDIADLTGGEFILTSNLNAAMQRIRSEIIKLGSGKREIMVPGQYAHQYGWFAGLALLLLAAELLIPYRGNRKGIMERISLDS